MQRLKTRAQFQAALASSLIAKSTHFAMHQVEFNLLAAPQLSVLFPSQVLWAGAMVPKRWAKRAVTRNTIKRQIYTAMSGLNNGSVQAAFLIRQRREFSRQMFPSATSPELRRAVRVELLDLLQAAQINPHKRAPAT